MYVMALIILKNETSPQSGPSHPSEFFFQFPDPALSLNAALALIVGPSLRCICTTFGAVGAGPLVIKGHDVTAGRGIVPFQPTGVPA